MNAEIVSIGSELLLGQIVDTNASWIAQRLAESGVNLFYKTTVGDNLNRMVDILDQSLDRSIDRDSWPARPTDALIALQVRPDT